MSILGYTFTENKTADTIQCDALTLANCERVYSDTLNQRSQRDMLLNEIIKPGDTLIIWRLCRFADSVAQLQKLLLIIDNKNITLVTIQEKIRHSFKSDKLSELVEAMAKIERDIKLSQSQSNSSR